MIWQTVAMTVTKSGQNRFLASVYAFSGLNSFSDIWLGDSWLLQLRMQMYLLKNEVVCFHLFFFFSPKFWSPLPLSPCDDDSYNICWSNLFSDTYFGCGPWEIDSLFSDGFSLWSVLKTGISRSFFQKASLHSLYKWENLHPPCQFAGVLPRELLCF